MTDDEWKRVMLMSPEERQQYMNTRNKVKGGCCCALVLLVLMLMFSASCKKMTNRVLDEDKAKYAPPHQTTPAPQQLTPPQGYSWPETSGPTQ